MNFTGRADLFSTLVTLYLGETAGLSAEQLYARFHALTDTLIAPENQTPPPESHV